MWAPTAVCVSSVNEPQDWEEEEGQGLGGAEADRTRVCGNDARNFRH